MKYLIFLLFFYFVFANPGAVTGGGLATCAYTEQGTPRCVCWDGQTQVPGAVTYSNPNYYDSNGNIVSSASCPTMPSLPTTGPL
jgi:glyceraldehyde-3-phosphate dehydrogenase/erythrose-4-phosphate dehydrogenase